MAVIKVKPWGKGQGDHVLIDDFLFDPSKHELYEPEQPKAATVSIEPQPTVVVSIEPGLYSQEMVEEVIAKFPGEDPPAPEPKKRGRPAKVRETE